MKTNKKIILIIFLFCLIFFDRFFKILSLKSKGGFFIIPKFFRFTFFANHRLAFSLPAPQILIIILSIIIIFILSLYLLISFKSQKKKEGLALLAIIIGALSNLFDRVSLGYVIDYLHLWPISYFNLADLMIGAGVLYLVLLFI